MRKYASLEVLEAWRQPAPDRITRTAHRVAFDYQPREGYLYVRARMISSRTNDNHDTFPAEEIEKGYKTFLGKPAFVNHHNENHRRARGVIVAVALHRDKNPDGTADTWVEGLHEIDAVRFPKLAKAIIAKRVNRTSMGVDVEWSTCSACGNKATSPAEYCKHLPAMKGKKIRQRNKVTGKIEEKLIHEVCAGLSFFENSLLVEDPADPTAFVIGEPDARGMAKAAARKTADLKPFDQLQPHEQASVAHYHPQMVEEGNAPAGSTPHDYLYEPRQEPKSDFLGRYMDADDEFKSQYGPGDWEAHHAETLATHPIPRYPQENRWPLVVSDANPNYVDDGYHRLHSYMRDGAGEVPTVRMHPKTAAVSFEDDEPDFRDHHANTCRKCGEPVAFLPGSRNGKYPPRWKHDLMAQPDHQPEPVNPELKNPKMFPSVFGGTHCAVCGDDVKINMHALNRSNGGWHHHDGMKRDHLAVPMHPQDVYNSIPGVRAQHDQARQQVKDHMHSLFEQMEGGPVARRPHGDEHLMPPDPFTASRREAAFMAEKPDHCTNCGTKFGSPYTDSKAGNWPSPGVPLLCNDCMLGHLGGAEQSAKAMPVRPRDFGGTRYHPVASESMDYAEDYEPGPLRRWQPGDGLKHSENARRDKPKPVRGYGRDPRFDGVALKKDKNGFYVHTHRARSDSYPTVDDIPAKDIEFIRSTGALNVGPGPGNAQYGDHNTQVNTFGEQPKAAGPRKREGGEHPWFKDHPVSKDHIVRAYSETTPDEKALGDRWYSDAHHVAKAIAGGDAALGAGLLSAYSPQTAWPVNMFNASRAAQGDPPGPGSGAMGQQQKSAVRILGGEHHSDVLKAPKTSAFAHLIEHGGDSPDDEAAGKSRVVIDRHALSVAHGARLSKEEGGKAPLGQPQHYEHVEQLYRDAAHDLSKASGRKISPHQVQAATWLGQIRKNQAEDSSGARGGGGKGRVQMHTNSQDRWVEHHHQHHPGGIDAENMHYHGSLEEGGSHCPGCGREFSGESSGGHGMLRSRVLPFMCADCGARHVQGDDIRAEQPPWSSRPYERGDMLRQSQNSLRVQAYGETRVPPQVDTLRMDECPVCGEHNVWSGSRCPVCGFVVPPSVFRDPDTSKAGDVRDQLDSSGDVTLPPDQADASQPDAQQGGQPAMAQPPMGSGEDADDQLVHPDQIAPDGVPTVQGGGPQDTDGQPPQDQDAASGMEDPDAMEQDEEEQNLAGEGDVPPEDPAGEPEDQPGDDLICPACGTTFETDAAAQPGVPCPACGMAALHLLDEEDPGDGTEPPEGAEDPPGDGEEKPEAEQDEEEDEDMPASKTAAALAQAQANRITELSTQNEILHAQLSFLASAAGVDRELNDIAQQVMRRRADILNPASPVPDPPEAPATETTEQALMPEAMDNAGRPGTTPGANSRVPAQQTTTAITPGVEMQTPPATNLVDVTAPVQGTNPSQDGGVPLSQRRIETDVRIDPDPLKASGPGIGGQGGNGAAFPWILDARGDGQQGGQPEQKEASASRRTFASIRLAKLRVQAGIAQGDELAVAERIERDAALALPVIEHEIGVLSQMPLAQQRQAARPVQRTAARSVPSLASVGASAQYAPAVMDDLDASDLFD